MELRAFFIGSFINILKKYESNHNGIESCIGWEINKVEVLVYESNHNGIESFSSSSVSAEKLIKYESNHNGIESENRFSNFWCRILYESNHNGIESSRLL